MTSGAPKDTQVMERPVLAEFAGKDIGQAAICWMIESGEEPRRIFQTILECSLKVNGVSGAAVYLPSEKKESRQELVCSAGYYSPGNDAEAMQRGPSIPNLIKTIATGVTVCQANAHYYVDVICLGAPIGSLVVVAEAGLDSEAIGLLRSLSHHISVVFERQKLSNTLQHFLDRLEVLNELNQLIASNVGLQRIVKSLARESAFRFAADVALTFLLNENGTALEVKGGYGCTPNLIPKQLPLDTGLLGQVMRLGGHLSVTNLQNYAQHELEFLEGLNIKAIDACCLEVRGDPLGAILIGFRREQNISRQDLTRFEEFCQGAAVAIANAITQERITSYTERLEELVEQRTADLAVQTARAEDANQAKSRFLANMSHELRTPLTAIVGYSSVLIDGIFGGLNDKQREALSAVVRSSEHLKKLIDDVLNLARIESGKEEASPDYLSAKDVLVQCYKLVLQQALDKKVTLAPLNLSESVSAAHIYADPKHTHQILINLLSNAVKYTPQGGEIRLNAELVYDKIKVIVTDTGVGIPPHKLRKLFERFERGDDTYSREQEGTGIGLNLTRHLIELNGGRIGVESEVGKGSQFWFLLPISTKSIEISTQTEPATEVSVRLDGLSILVVDDNKDTTEVLKHILLAAGASVAAVNTVREGVSSLDTTPPDIVLTDLAIPGESGLVLIDYIRKNRASSLPILVLSACAFQKDKEAALEAGASLFVPKPFRPNDILKAVRQLTLGTALSGKRG